MSSCCFRPWSTTDVRLSLASLKVCLTPVCIMHRLQIENRDLKERNATLNRRVRSVKDQRSQQGAREEETHAQQLVLRQTLTHLLEENAALKRELCNNNSRVKSTKMRVSQTVICDREDETFSHAMTDLDTREGLWLEYACAHAGQICMSGLIVCILAVLLHVHCLYASS